MEWSLFLALYSLRNSWNSIAEGLSAQFNGTRPHLREWQALSARGTEGGNALFGSESGTNLAHESKPPERLPGESPTAVLDLNIAWHKTS
jgi:hypothetical protein